MPRDDPGDEEQHGPPPHPLDRPWAHPTEMFARARARTAATTRARSQRSRRRDVLIALGAGVAGALVTVGMLVAAGAFRTSSAPTAVVPTGVTTTDDGARLAALAGPSVVAVLATTPTGARRVSGVSLSDGRVVTAAAAVAGATGLRVLEADGADHGATSLGHDDETGLAVLRAAGREIPSAQLAGDRDVRVGQWVVAVGRGDTATAWAATGVVASLGGWAVDGDGVRRAGLIATTMAVPRSAEGGALVDGTGHVVGILAGAPDGGTFAMPIARVRDVADELARSGKVTHGALGVRAVDSPSEHGAEVTDVLPGTAAAAAGLAPGDVVMGVAGAPVRDTAMLVVEVTQHKPDDVVALRIRRGHDDITVRVRLDDASARTEEPSPPGSGDAAAVATTAGVAAAGVGAAG